MKLLLIVIGQEFPDKINLKNLLCVEFDLSIEVITEIVHISDNNNNQYIDQYITTI